MKVFCTHGVKGGCGKSIVSGAMIDTIYNKNLGTVHVIETDLATADVGKAYENAPFITACSFIDLSDGDGFIELVNTIQNSEADYIVINSPAGEGAWFEFGNTLTESLIELEIPFTTFWLLGLQRDSVEPLNIYFNEVSKNVIPVVNTYFGNTHKFTIWNESDLRKEVLQSNGNKELVFPATAERIIVEMRKTRRRWDDETNLPVSHKFESRRFRRAMSSALEPVLM